MSHNLEFENDFLSTTPNGRQQPVPASAIVVHRVTGVFEEVKIFVGNTNATDTDVGIGIDDGTNLIYFTVSGTTAGAPGWVKVLDTRVGSGAKIYMIAEAASRLHYQGYVNRARTF